MTRPRGFTLVALLVLVGLTAVLWVRGAAARARCGASCARSDWRRGTTERPRASGNPGLVHGRLYRRDGVTRLTGAVLPGAGKAPRGLTGLTPRIRRGLRNAVRPDRHAGEVPGVFRATAAGRASATGRR
jgi:hypothetical protein